MLLTQISHSLPHPSMRVLAIAMPRAGVTHLLSSNLVPNQLAGSPTSLLVLPL